MERTVTTAEPDYILGHTAAELDRLIAQARYFGDLTASVFQMAGLTTGMHILDAGCGAGDVSFLAAQMVGPSGMVLGVDKSPEAVALATQRAKQAGLSNVRFVAADLAQFTHDERFDALVGRLVLMYFADPEVIVRRLAQLVRPGGLIVFHEFDLYNATSEPHCELYQTSIDRLIQTFSRAGIQPRAGLKLNQIFTAAGLPAPQMIQGARVEHGADSLAYEQVTRVTESLLPAMEMTGVARADEVQIDTLASRLRAENIARQATIVSPGFVGAWVRKPV